MRFEIHKKRKGASKFRRKFAFLPKVIKGNFVWLEFYSDYYECREISQGKFKWIKAGRGFTNSDSLYKD